MSFEARTDEPEMLDLGYGTLHDVAENLAQMTRINRVLGGYRALTRHLCPRLANCREPVTLLDLGTGNAGFPRHILLWAVRRGIKLRACGVDVATRNLAIAAGAVHRPSLLLLQADALQLPFKHSGADFIVSSLFMHHFKPDELVALLRRSFAVARRSLIMSDLIRSRAAHAAFRLVPPPLAGNFLTRYDGALSIRRAYTPGELRALAVAAGLPRPQVSIHWPWRMTLVADK